MLFSVLVTFVAAGIAAANPLKRQLAQVITDCVNPNDAALTFVCESLHASVSSLISPFIQDDGPWNFE